MRHGEARMGSSRAGGVGGGGICLPFQVRLLAALPPTFGCKGSISLV